MQIWYEGKDITDFVIPRACIHRDAGGGKADTLEIAFRRASAWHRWEPETDDKIQIVSGKYSTGEMYVNTIVPEADCFRMIASSLPSAASRKAWDSYSGMELAALLHRLAKECGMDGKLYGANGTIRYEYIQRKNEGCAALLQRICGWEGMELKAFNGIFRCVSIEYAQSLEAVRAWSIDADQDGVTYRHQPGTKWSSVTVLTPWAEATAMDSDAKNGSAKIISGLPAFDTATAGRWARGILLTHNRQADRLRIGMRFDPGAAAMTKARISGNTGASGEWLIDEVEQDLYNETTTVNLLRVINTVR